MSDNNGDGAKYLTFEENHRPGLTAAEYLHYARAMDHSGKHSGAANAACTANSTGSSGTPNAACTTNSGKSRRCHLFVFHRGAAVFSEPSGCVGRLSAGRQSGRPFKSPSSYSTPAQHTTLGASTPRRGER